MGISFVLATNHESRKAGLKLNSTPHWLVSISDNVIGSEASCDGFHCFLPRTLKMPGKQRIKSSKRRQKQLIHARKHREKKGEGEEKGKPTYLSSSGRKLSLGQGNEGGDEYASQRTE